MIFVGCIPDFRSICDKKNIILIKILEIMEKTPQLWNNDHEKSGSRGASSANGSEAFYAKIY